MATSTTRLDWDEAAAPATPAASKVRVYAKSDGLMYSKDDAGAETLMSAGGAGIPVTTVDVKGDLIAATAADTVSRLAAGSNDKALIAASGESTGLKWDYAMPSCYENFLTAPVTVVNADTWYAGPALTPAAGTYLFIGHLTASSSFSGTTSITAGLGTANPPTASNGQAYTPAATQTVSITVTARITVNGSDTVTLYGLSARGSSVVSILDTTTSGGITDKASSLVAMRITSL